MKTFILAITVILFINVGSISVYADESDNSGYAEVYYDRLTGEKVGYDLYLNEEDATFIWEKPSEINKMIIYRSESYGEYIKLEEVNADTCYYKDNTYIPAKEYLYKIEAEFKDGSTDIFCELATEASEEISDAAAIVITIGMLIMFVLFIAGILILVIPREDKSKEELMEKKGISTIVWTIFLLPVGLYKIIKYRDENNRGYYIKWLLYLIMPLGLYILWKEDTFNKSNKILLTVGASILALAPFIFFISFGIAVGIDASMYI